MDSFFQTLNSIMPQHAMILMVVVLCVLAAGYAIYSRFIAFRLLQLDDSRQTPAYTLRDGHNYDPTNKWVLFGHHFAAISGAGPLIGPVLAAQFGYLPGLLWILVGVVLGGAVQDFIVLVFSIRRQGKSLANIAYDEVSPTTGWAAMIGILFVLVIALAGLGIIVVKALGGETVEYPAGTVFVSPDQLNRNAAASPAAATTPFTRLKSARIVAKDNSDRTTIYSVPAGSVIQYPNNTPPVIVAAPFLIRAKPRNSPYPAHLGADEGADTGLIRTVPADIEVTRAIQGSPWGTFTIALTIPIALFVGLYMYRIRKGKVLEASIIGGLLTLGAVYLGSFLSDQNADSTNLLVLTFGKAFNLSQDDVSIAMAVYGFLASILPVWLLLCPRDYLSSFLKIGTVALLVLGVILANPTLHAPAVNTLFLGGGPIVKGSIFPFVFITIMCGAISGFHALVSSGTTPKMIMKESHARPIGYGAMLIEGLVAIVALIAASALPASHYYNMNTSWRDLNSYQQQIVQVAQADDAAEKARGESNHVPALPIIENQVGESLQGRTGGAVTLAVGMAEIFDQAAKNVLGESSKGVTWLEGMIPYWYHFAIMFEALFILTTIDAGTRVGRFLLQEIFGKIIGPTWAKTDYWPSAVLATGLLVLGWWYFIYTGSVDRIWPMFGIANQLLAVIALAVCSVIIVKSGKGRYVWVTLVPMAFVTLTTMTTAVILLGRFGDIVLHGSEHNIPATQIFNAGLSAAMILGIVACTCVILGGCVKRILKGQPVSQIAKT